MARSTTPQEALTPPANPTSPSSSPQSLQCHHLPPLHHLCHHQECHLCSPRHTTQCHPVPTTTSSPHCHLLSPYYTFLVPSAIPSPLPPPVPTPFVPSAIPSPLPPCPLAPHVPPAPIPLLPTSPLSPLTLHPPYPPPSPWSLLPPTPPLPPPVLHAPIVPNVPSTPPPPVTSLPPSHRGERRACALGSAAAVPAGGRGRDGGGGRGGAPSGSLPAQRQSGGRARGEAPTHELRFPALQFQDAEHRVPEPASQHIHRGFWHGHLRLHPQFTVLLLLDQAQTSSAQRALRLQTGYTQGEGEGVEPARDLCRLLGGVQAQGRAGDLPVQTCLPQKVPHQVVGGTQGVPALQHASAAAGTAAQQAGPRPPPGPPARSREHRIALCHHRLPRGCWGAPGDDQSTTAPARSEAGDGRTES